MSVTLRWEGLDELRAELRRLPEDLAGEGSEIVVGSAESAEADIAKGYAAHVRSGKLARGLKVQKIQGGRFGAGAVVKNTAKHAHLFELGTQARHTAIGANRGSMPPAHVFIPAVVRRRRQMYQRLKDLLQRHGLIASGDA